MVPPLGRRPARVCSCCASDVKRPGYHQRAESLRPLLRVSSLFRLSEYPFGFPTHRSRYSFLDNCFCYFAWLEHCGFLWGHDGTSLLFASPEDAVGRLLSHIAYNIAVHFLSFTRRAIEHLRAGSRHAWLGLTFAKTETPFRNRYSPIHRSQNNN